MQVEMSGSEDEVLGGTRSAWVEEVVTKRPSVALLGRGKTQIL